jgi:ATP-binding cassette subfamily B protein
VIFDQVSFAHGDVAVLEDVSFEVRPGQTLALLGPSGAGKSTIVNLLLRLYDPDSGTIRCHGRDLATIERKHAREDLAVVLQEPFLYSKTVRENIRLGRRTAADEEIYEAASIACVHQTILDFDNGYDTVVGERGVTLSGGQRQRVALARALLERPKILVLDDALSAVDTGTEQMILTALTERRGKQTTIVIAHRLSTLRHADQILVLDAGRVVQRGTHEALLAEAGLYRRLWSIQTELRTELDHELAAAPPSGAVTT